MRFHYRCSREACKTRHVFPRMMEEYKVPRKCKVCGGKKFRLDATRQAKGANEGRPVCRCDGYMHPHRRGGGVWCIHHPTGPTNEDFELVYGPQAM